MSSILSGGQIREMRTGMGLSQADFADRIGLDAGTVSRIERGLEVNARVAFKLSKFFNLPIERFYEDKTVGAAS